jgi:hypothetical protein
MELYKNNHSKINALNNKSKRLHIEKNPFIQKLKKHQEALLFKALEIDEKFSNSSLPFGVFSYKPGSGKTFVVLALIYYSKIFFNSTGPNIIIVPHNIYTQWINAINNFTGKLLSYKCLLEYSEITALFSNQDLLYKYDIIISTPLNYGVFASIINSIGIKIRRIFFDEADSLKDLIVNAINSEMTWFISASIKTVFDKKTLKAKIGIYDLYLPDLLQNECYCDNKFIDENIKLPQANIQTFICRDFYIDNILINILSDEQIKYINAHDYFEIRSLCNGFNVQNTKEISRHIYLNSKKIINEQDSLLKEFEKKLKYPNREEYSKLVESKNKIESKKNIYVNIFNQLKNLAEKNNICIECWENIIDDSNVDFNKIIYFRSECNDKICIKCYKRINNKYNCVTCKHDHLLDTYKSEEILINDDMIKLSIKNKINKFKILNKIMDITGDKVLIYSKYRNLSNYLKDYCTQNNTEYVELNGGNIKQIDIILNNFKLNPNVKILLIDNSYFGVGLNIEYATDIIFIHSIDIETENQLIGRAQRYGRINKLNIWKLLYMNEK